MAYERISTKVLARRYRACETRIRYNEKMMNQIRLEVVRRNEQTEFEEALSLDKRNLI